MTRPDPGAGGTDGGKGFHKVYNAWEQLRWWIYRTPQARWSQVNDSIDKLKRART